MSITSPTHHRQDGDMPYYQKFTLPELGIDSAQFLRHLGPTYSQLLWDMYDVERGGLEKPTRQRAMAEFELQRTKNDWQIHRLPTTPYVQATNHGEYDRTQPREYPEVAESVTNYVGVVQLQKSIADIVHRIRQDAEQLRMIFTFTRIVVDEERAGLCTIEDIHSDGMDYIVSALVIKRENVLPQSGVSSVHTLAKQELMRTVLQPGEGIFQDDVQLMHNITKIQQQTRGIPGIRDTLGIDVRILS